jgi:hypothetical protein
MPRPLRAIHALRAALAAGLAAGAAFLLLIAPQRSCAQSAPSGGNNLGLLLSSQGDVLDDGVFIISQKGKPVRTEEFAIQRTPDTLLVRAASRVALPGQAERPVDKKMVLVVGPLDFAMGNYWSELSAGPDTLRRGVEVAPGDTLFTLWREVNGAGIGDTVEMPPGRVYILDPPLFSVFNFIGWTLQGKACDRRPIHVFVLGVRDSMVDATVTDVGTETIRWGGRPVQARKLVIADQTTSFTTWFTPDGRMLRLEQPRDSIRVDRKPPPLKRQPPRK